MRFALTIFDCDGVLVDSEPIANRIFTDELGIRLTVLGTPAERSIPGTTKPLELIR